MSQAGISIGIISPGAVALTEPDSGFPVGGAELQCWLLAKRLAQAEGINATLYVGDLGQKPREEDGLCIAPFIDVKDDLSPKTSSLLTVWWKLWTCQHHVIVSASPSGLNGFITLICRLRNRRHLYLCMHDDEARNHLDHPLGKMAALLHRYSLRQCHEVLCQNEAQRREMKQNHGREAVIFPTLTAPSPHVDKTWQLLHERAIGLTEKQHDFHEQAVHHLRNMARPQDTTIWPSLRTFARLILVLGLLVALVVIAKPDQLWAALSQGDYLFVLAAVPLLVGATMLDAFRLYLLMLPHGYRQGWWAMVRTNFVVNFLSTFLPGTIGGGVVAWYRLARPERLHAQTFTALALNTTLKFVAMCTVGAGMLALDVAREDEYAKLMLPLSVCAVLPLAGFFTMLWTPATAWLRRLNVIFSARVVPRKISDGVEKLIQSIENYRPNWPGVLMGLAASIARIALTVLAVQCCLHAFNVKSLTFVRVAWIMACVEAAAMLPFSLSGLGLPQATMAGLFITSGIARSTAVAVTFVSYIPVLPILLVGACILLFEAAPPKTGKAAEP